MLEINLKRFLVLIVLLSMIIPVGMGTVLATELNDPLNASRSGMDRGAIPDDDSQTAEVPEDSPSSLSGMSLESVMDLNKKSPSITYLGKNPNLALDFTNMEPVYFGEGSSESRAEPADNSYTGANVMTHNMAARNDSIGGTDTQDWYSASLTTTTNAHDEMTISFTNKETTEGRNITVVIYDSYNQQYPLYNSRTWAYSDGSGNTFTPGGIPANTTKVMTVRAPRTGTYYMQVVPHLTLTGSFSYSIDSVSINGENPVDHNNQWETASKESSTTFLGSLNQATNHWNWHNISGQFANTGSDYDNNLSYTMTVTAEAKGAIEELNSIASFDWVTWTMVSILFNNDADDWYLYHHEFYSGGSRNVQFGNNVFNPERGGVVVNGTWAYIGVECKSAFVWLDTAPNPDEVVIHNWYNVGTSSYSMAIAVEELDLNFKPQLNFGSVTPTQGNVDEDYNFEVKFTDLNNEPPQSIKVIVDSTLEFDMVIKQGELDNYDQGVIYQSKVSGDALDDDPYPHTYRFEATDGRKEAWGDTGDHSDLYIIKNTPPELHPDAIAQFVMDEDDASEFIDLYSLFYDPDGDTDVLNDLDGNTLDFELRNADDNAWGNTFMDDIVSVTLFEIGTDANKIRIQPLENQYGQTIIKLKATDESQYGSDNYEWEIETTLTITINEINDAPVLLTVPDFTDTSAGTIKEDEFWLFTFSASDVDDPVLMYSTDIEEQIIVDGDQVLTTDPHEYGFTFDAFTGTINITPSNDMVGIHTIEVTVSDNDPEDPQTDTDEFILEIVNTNDKPIITAIGKKDVIEGSALVFNARQKTKLDLHIHAEDPDIDIGESDELTYKMDVEERENLLIDTEKGIVTFTPNQEDVDARRIFIILSVEDNFGASDDVEIRIQIENVNDPPSLDGVEVIVIDADPATPQAENLTVKFKVQGGNDPDGDAITYSWDFNADDNLDNIGGSDDDAELIGTENIMHTYPSPGRYEIVVTAKDTTGAAIKFNLTVEVQEPKKYVTPVTDGDDGRVDEGFLNSEYGGVNASVWIIVIVVLLILTFMIVMFVVKKKGAEIEKLRHAERFREDMDGPMGPDGMPIRADEGSGMGAGGGFPQDAHVATSAAELYQTDSATATPSLLDMPQQQLGGAPGAMPPQQPFGGPMQPQQPLGLPPAASPMQPAAQTGVAGGNMTCTSCGTPINPEWYICPGCHRFLK